MVDYENVLEENDREKRIEIILTDSYNEFEQDEASAAILKITLPSPLKHESAVTKNQKFSLSLDSPRSPHNE